jgi:hypothetical protein
MSTLADRLRGFEPKPRTKLAGVFRKDGVRDSAEFRRIANLPRRALVLPADTLDLSQAFATSDGDMVLKPIQAFAIEETYRVGGLVASIRVGGGKTIISFLLARALETKRAVLLVPADLVDKTRNDFARLAEHFHVPREHVPTVMSYQMLALEQSAETLAKLAPDLIVADEGHYLKNPKASRTRRVGRHLTRNPSCRFVVMSGTLTTTGLAECAHLYDWALRERSPLPRKYSEVTEWGLAVDERLQNPMARMEAGCLALLMDADDRRVHRDDPIAATRAAVRKRIHDTAGVVATTDDGPGMSLVIHLRIVEGYNAATEAAFTTLHAAWETPSGETFSDAVTKWRHECELAQGFYYRYRVEPPAEWLARRRTWNSIVKHILDHNRRDLDSPKQVESAVLRGDYDGETANSSGMAIGGCTIDEAYRAWIEIRGEYERETVPVWIDERIVREVREWLAEGPGLVWVSHIAVGEHLSKALKLPYYRTEGRDARGNLIDNAKRGTSAIASIHSCRAGRNLQGIWSRALYAVDALGGEAMEQSIGRIHRDGQPDDEVSITILIGCAAQWRGFERACGQADYARDVTGQPQKLGLATIVRPARLPSGPRWIGAQA